MTPEPRPPSRRSRRRLRRPRELVAEELPQQRIVRQLRAGRLHAPLDLTVTTAGAICSTSGAYESADAPIVRAGAPAGAARECRGGRRRKRSAPMAEALQPISDPVRSSAPADSPALRRTRPAPGTAGSG